MSMKSQKGNALMLIVVLMAAIGLASTAFFINFQSSSTTGGGLFQHKRSFYAAEGTLLMVIKLSQSYLSETVAPNSGELRQKLADELPGLVGSQYQVSDIDVQIEGAPTISPIPTGTFKGMIAPQTIVKVSYSVKTIQDTVAGSVVRMQATLSLAQVAMFQFLYFIDLLYADFSPGPIMRLNGRVHSNGDLCLTGALGLYMGQVTSAGRLMFGNDARCKYRLTGDEVYIASGPNLTLPVKLRLDNENGCTNCGGTGLSWADYAPATWNGNALDSSHDVNNMILPIPSAVEAQVGADGNDPWLGQSNSKNLRFITDPVNPGDTDPIARQKFAYKADIRIIAGVWYLRDRTNPRSWPGIPIWSDHPGSATDDWGNAVGQNDLAGRWGWGSVPHRYSYYEYDTTNRTLYDDRRGVISYGNLFTDTSTTPPTRHPGHWLSGAPQADRVCPSGVLLSAQGFLDAFNPIRCSSPGSPGLATALLNATRGGIHDGHARRLYPNAAEQAQRAKVLPMNFDLAEFQAALADVTPGELGSYFGSGRYMGDDFNGIIYVTTSWPGWLTGFNPRNQPQQPPLQGANGDAITPQPGVFGQQTQQALPITLCANAPYGGQAFDTFDNGGTPASRFRIPACDSYRLGNINAYPTKIRIINGKTIDPARLRKGLSFVTNIGLYLSGEYNKDSDTSSESATPWVPSLVAADQITFLSNAWSDGNSAWNDDAHTAPRIASPTEYHTAILTGWARSSSSMTLHAFPSMMEDWRTAQITFDGSTVVGFYPVYERYGRYYDSVSLGYTYRAGTREINFDKHFQFTANQPPGAPLFFISALLDWKAE